MVASHPQPHSPHVHGTFLLDAGRKSFCLLLRSAHSPSRSSRPVSRQYTSKLCVAVGTLPAHAGHPPPRVRCPTWAPHLCPHSSFPHFHHTFSLDPRDTSCAPLMGSSHSSSKSSRPCLGHQSSRVSPWRPALGGGNSTAPPRRRSHPTVPPPAPRRGSARAPHAGAGAVPTHRIADIPLHRSSEHPPPSHRSAVPVSALRFENNLPPFPAPVQNVRGAREQVSARGRRRDRRATLVALIPR
jgi:hypothetical protein